MSEPAAPIVRIAMWSGPRNISTALMRAFEARGDASVIDEPFYAAYLARTGADHPLREAVLASQPPDLCKVVALLERAGSPEKPIVYEKHMAHHMAPDADLGWMDERRNAFLIRSPERVLASYARRRGGAQLEDFGYARAVELFDRQADRLGAAPPVIEAEDVLADARGLLKALCEALAIPFRESMLSWPAGRRASDGAWAPAWYSTVERSTGFAPAAPESAPPRLDRDLRRIADAARPYYERMAQYRLPGIGE